MYGNDKLIYNILENNEYNIIIIISQKFIKTLIYIIIYNLIYQWKFIS